MAIRKRDGTFNKKDINAFSEFKNSFRKESKKRRDNQVPFLVEDVRKSEELNAVEAFRQALTKNDLLPANFDDYYMMLRFLKARKFDMEQAKCMWANMLQWKSDFVYEPNLHSSLNGFFKDGHKYGCSIIANNHLTQEFVYCSNMVVPSSPTITSRKGLSTALSTMCVHENAVKNNPLELSDSVLLEELII